MSIQNICFFCAMGRHEECEGGKCSCFYCTDQPAGQVVSTSAIAGTLTAEQALPSRRSPEPVPADPLTPTPKEVQKILALIPSPPISSVFKEKEMAFLPGEMRVLHNYIRTLEAKLSRIEAETAELVAAAEHAVNESRREFERGEIEDIDRLEDAIRAMLAAAPAHGEKDK